MTNGLEKDTSLRFKVVVPVLLVLNTLLGDLVLLVVVVFVVDVVLLGLLILESLHVLVTAPRVDVGSLE